MKGLIDSTLREGTQTFGLTFSLAQKMEILTDLCSVGIEEIEIGIATKLDKNLPQLVKYCRSIGSGNRLALWCRCRNEDILFAHALQPDVLSLSIPVSDIHIKKKLRSDRKLIIETAELSIRKARQLGFKYISLGLEDATRADLGFLKKIVKKAIASRVDRIRLADTVGIANPIEFAGLVATIKSLGPVEVGVHAHNDFGMATANSLAALDAGGDWADVTILGLGERAGNARLEELASYFTLQREKGYKLATLKNLAVKVAHMFGRKIDPHKPIIGEKIFYCETGLHLQGLKKDTSTYEPYPPEMVGARRKLQYGSKIGRKEVYNCLRGMKVNPANFNLDEMVQFIWRRAKLIGRPLKRKELQFILSSISNR